MTTVVPPLRQDAGTGALYLKDQAGSWRQLLFAPASPGSLTTVLHGNATGAPSFGPVVLNTDVSGYLPLTRTDFTAAHTVVPAEFGLYLRGDATGATFAFTLPVTANEGDWVAFRKMDSSVNRVSVKNSSAVDVAWLSLQYDQVIFAWWNGVWTPAQWRIGDLMVEYTVGGTAITPPLCREADLIAWGGGAGGGSGRRGAAASARSGGTGGFSPIATQRLGVTRLALGASVVVTIGAGGAGGAAITVDDTNGADGVAGSDTTIGSLLRSRGGLPGKGGTNAGTSALADTTLDYGALLNPSTTSITVALGSSTVGNALGGSPGGSGGSLTTGNAEILGQRGPWGAFADPAISPAAVGTSGAAGAAGATSALPGFAGPGGGGGGPSAAAAGGAGGAGGKGSGGGGGGASVNGQVSGAGGAGGGGKAAIVYRFN